jgi:hypothetical protein
MRRNGTTPFESGSVSARVTLLPAVEPFIPVAVALSAKNGATAAVLAPAFGVTTNTAGADAGALPEVPVRRLKTFTKRSRDMSLYSR